MERAPKRERKKAIDAIDAKYPGKKLLEYKNKTCKNVMYGDVACDFVRDVVFKQREDSVVKNYLANKVQLKKDYNECLKKYKPLYLDGKYKEAQKVENSYKCQMAKSAAYKLGILFNYVSKPMK